MNEIFGENVPELYSNAWWNMRIMGKEEDSRNGRVMTIQEPTIIQLDNPRQRVLFDPERDANPFFHVMETVWMLAGENDVKWLEQFNKGYRNYAEDNGEVWGAYGHRWRSHFGSYSGENPNDQINSIVKILRKDPNDRRAVIAMWDAGCDLGAAVRDVPCNTHIYFRVVRGKLDMTVCNRSNDMVWGALGANIVHMTYLHELIASASDIPVGTYRVLTNNLHVYKDRENIKKLWNTSLTYDEYWRGLNPFELTWEGKHLDIFLRECECFVADIDNGFSSPWLRQVAEPMYRAYLDKERRKEWINKIAAEDWRLACDQWWDRRTQSSST